MTINEKQDEIIAEMSELDDWMDRYAYIIDLETRSLLLQRNIKRRKTS